MAYTAHLRLLTVPVAVPGRRRGQVLISERERQLVAYIMAGRAKGKPQRTMASELGYSLAGLNEALHSLNRLGILALSCTRGWAGSTVAWVVRGVHVIGGSVAAMAVRMFGNVSESTYIREAPIPNIDRQRPPPRPRR